MCFEIGGYRCHRTEIRIRGFLRLVVFQQENAMKSADGRDRTEAEVKQLFSSPLSYATCGMRKIKKIPAEAAPAPAVLKVAFAVALCTYQNYPRCRFGSAWTIGDS